MVEQRRPAPDEPRILTPGWAADKAADYGRRFAEGVAASGVTVIGDPEELARRPASGKNKRPASLSMDAAVAATAGLVRRSTGGSGAEQPGRAEALRILLRRRGRGGEAPEGAEPQA